MLGELKQIGILTLIGTFSNGSLSCSCECDDITRTHFFLCTGADSMLGLSEITENKKVWRMIVAEFVGTLLLVFLGCAAVIENESRTQISLAFGLIVATLAQVSQVKCKVQIFITYDIIKRENTCRMPFLVNL